MTKSPKSTPTVIICPGKGCTNICESNWCGALHRLVLNKSITCICENFPHPYHAHNEKWVAYIQSLIVQHSANYLNNAILMGHSSGAQASLQYAELYSSHGIILVLGRYSEIGNSGERASG
ncbi:hypothetical protein ACHAW6_010620 [Cyclotella cf. meneghiniana]